MSARTEKLLEEIEAVKTALRLSEESGNATLAVKLRASLKELSNQLNASNEALTEGKHLIKG